MTTKLTMEQGRALVARIEKYRLTKGVSFKEAFAANKTHGSLYYKWKERTTSKKAIVVTKPVKTTQRKTKVVPTAILETSIPVILTRLTPKQLADFMRQ